MSNDALAKLVDSYSARANAGTLRYKSEVGSQNLDPIDMASNLQKLLRMSHQYWRHFPGTGTDAEGEEQWQNPDSVVSRIGLAIRFAPAAIDHAFHVDGGGATLGFTEICRSTAWVRITTQSGLYARFSESRTALHSTKVLRSPIDGSGFSLEVTDKPLSVDPRDFITALVFQPMRGEDLNYPWIKPRPAEVFDMRQYDSVPYHVGPLYGGFPNKVKDEDMLQLVMIASRNLIVQALQTRLSRY